jgi:DNA-binding IclR family transcriptional regulator
MVARPCDLEAASLPRKQSAGQSQRRNSIQSVEVALRVVDVFIKAQGPLSFVEISKAARLSPGQTHRYLTSLARSGLVQQNSARGLYNLGGLAVRVGLAALSRLDFMKAAALGLEALAQRTGHTAALAVWSERGPLIVRWELGQQPVLTPYNLGAVLPVLSSATGRVFISFLPAQQTDALVKTEMQRNRRPDCPTNARDLAKLKARIRSTHIERLESTVVPGLFAVSSPILDYQGSAVAALTISDIDTRRIAQDKAAEAILLDVTSAISSDLGFKGTSEPDATRS